MSHSTPYPFDNPVSCFGTKNKAINPTKKKNATERTENLSDPVKDSIKPKKNIPITIPIFSVAS